MGKLIVQSSEFAGQEFNLVPGCNSVGRNPGNLVEIPHSSISGQHGELEEDPKGWLAVRDLGSTNGTVYEGQQVAEAFVSPGETFQLGDVVVLYAADTPAPAAALPPALPPEEEEAKPSGKACKKHPELNVSLICPQCQLKMCERCVNQVEISGKIKNYCPTCKQICTPLQKHKKEKRRKRKKRNAPFGNVCRRSSSIRFAVPAFRCWRSARCGP